MERPPLPVLPTLKIDGAIAQSRSENENESEGLETQYLAGFMLVGLLAGISNGITKVVLPLYAAFLGADSWQIGLVGGIQFLGMCLLSIPIGALIDRIGSRRLFLFGGLSGVAVYGLLFPLMTTPWQLVGGVLILGLLNPFRMVTTQTEFLHLLPLLGHRRAGWNRAAHTTGMFFLGPSLGALLLSWLGYGEIFLCAALGLLLTALVGNRVMGALAMTSSNTRSTISADENTQHTITPPPLPIREKIRALFGIIAARPELRRSMGIEFFGQVAMTYFNVFIVLIGIRHFGMSTQAAAGLVTLQGACFVGTLFFGGGLLAPFSEKHRYMFSCALLLIASLCLGLPSGKASLWVGAALLGIGLGSQHLTSVSRFAALTHELGRGRVGGLFSISGPAGGLIGSLCGGLLGQYFGALSGFHVLSLIFTGQIALWLLYKKRETTACRTPA